MTIVTVTKSKSKSIVQVRITPEEKELWQEVADEETGGNLSQMIRSKINQSIETSSWGKKLDEILLNLKALNYTIEEIKQKK